MSYDFAVIRKMIGDAYSADELEIMCATHFPWVRHKFTTGQNNDMRILLLVEEVRHHRDVDRLLNVVKEERSKAYAEYEPLLKTTHHPPKEDGTHPWRAAILGAMLLTLLSLGAWYWRSHQESTGDNRPTPTPQDTPAPPVTGPVPSDTPITVPPETVRRTRVTLVAGKPVERDGAGVAPLGDIEGETQDSFPQGAQIFVYVRHRGGDNDAAFERFSPDRVGGGSWTVTGVRLRKALNAGVTKVDIRVAIVPQGQDLNVNSVPPDWMVPKSVEVSVPAPRLSDWKPRFDADGNLTAEGTIQNILVADEKLCFKVERISGGEPPMPLRDICPTLTEKEPGTYEWSILGPSVKANAGNIRVRAGLAAEDFIGEIIPERDFTQISQPQTLRR